MWKVNIVLCFLMMIWATPASAQKKAGKATAAKKKAVTKTPKKKTTKKKKKKTTSDNEEKPVATFNSVTVGSRAPEDPFKSSRAITSISKKTMRERNSRSTPDALLEHAGVYLQKTNHGAGAPIIRGTVGPQILLLVDGVRLNNSVYRSGPNQYLNIVDSLSLRNIEVLRGPGSIAFGSYAFGGVINMNTLDPELTKGSKVLGRLNLLGRYGSSDQELTAHTRGSVSYRGFAISLALTYSSFGDLYSGGEKEGFAGTTRTFADVYKNAHNFGDLNRGHRTGAQPFTGYQNFFIDTKFKWRLSSGWYLEGLYQKAMVMNAGRGDQYASKADVRFYSNDRDLVYLRLRGKLPNARTKLRVTMSFHKQHDNVRRYRLDKQSYKTTRETVTDDTVDTIGVSVDGNTRIGRRVKLSYGADFYYDMVDSEKLDKGKPAAPSFPVGSTYGNFGLFAIGNVKLVTWGKDNVLNLQVGDRFVGVFASAPANEKAGLDPVSFNMFGNAAHGALQVLLGRRWNFTFSFAQGFRAPNLQESTSLGDQGSAFEVPNPNLSPEYSNTFEFLIRKQIKDKFNIWAAVYYSLWQDLITRKGTEYKGQTKIDDKPVQQNVNENNANVLGVEAGFSYSFIERLTFSGNLTWTRGRAVASDGSETPLSRIPPLYGKASLRYDLRQKRGFLEFYSLMAMSQTVLSKKDEGDARIPQGGTPAWFTLNIRGGFNVSDMIRVNLSLENLLNTVYKYHGSGIMAPGLSGRVTLDFKI